MVGDVAVVDEPEVVVVEVERLIGGRGFVVDDGLVLLVLLPLHPSKDTVPTDMSTMIFLMVASWRSCDRAPRAGGPGSVLSAATGSAGARGKLREPGSIRTDQVPGTDTSRPRAATGSLTPTRAAWMMNLSKGTGPEVEGRSTMTTETDKTFRDYAIRSYRYLRLAIVVMVLSLGASVIIERAEAKCWQGSISAYYYTPAHSMFVGSLVAIGVCLIAIVGRKPWEDMFLNVAGMLAIVVAFVPTSPADRLLCAASGRVSADADAYINNNILAVAIGGVIALMIAAVIASKKDSLHAAKPSREVGVGLVITAALILAGVIWHTADRSTFDRDAHISAAIAMFLAIGVVVLVNVWEARGGYRVLYIVVVALMIAGVVAVLVGKAIDAEWRHEVFWLEALEITPFAVFWVAQTIEHWDEGIVLPGA